jgi:cytidine deaminase
MEHWDGGLMMTHDDLISEAEKVLKPVTKGSRMHADVGAAVLSEKGKLHVGVCVDTWGWGICAERSALAAMITSGEYAFQKVVAVCRDEKTGKLHVLPPCGICREFMRAIDPKNLEAKIILGPGREEALKDLIPHHEWPQPLN